MVMVYRGRPRNNEIETFALSATIELMEERGYDALRMKDVAARAGIGLGALYRRWSSKQELVMAALRAGLQDHADAEDGDPIDDLVAALLRVSNAVEQGLGALVAACLRQPESEIATVAREAKLEPMVAAVARHLQRVIGSADDLASRAELGPALILWQSAARGAPPDETDIRKILLPLMGVERVRPAN